MVPQKGKALVFQPSIFRGENVSFREGNLPKFCSLYISNLQFFPPDLEGEVYIKPSGLSLLLYLMLGLEME